MLPEHITTEVVRNASDLIDQSADAVLLNERIEEPMSDYICLVIEEIAGRLGLDDDQIGELFERVCWRLELLPKATQ